jgi:hypothetical protein
MGAALEHLALVLRDVWVQLVLFGFRFLVGRRKPVWLGVNLGLGPLGVSRRGSRTGGFGHCDTS